jgi:hypothetical protein
LRPGEPPRPPPRRSIGELQRQHVLDGVSRSPWRWKRARAEDEQAAAALPDEGARQRQLLRREQIGIDVGEHDDVVGEERFARVG